MKQFCSIDNYKKNNGTILVLGMFDGMHKGHIALFDKAKKIKDNYCITVLSFVNHFVEEKIKMLSTAKEKALLVEEQGADELILQTVDSDFMNTTAEDFISLIKEKINVKAIVVGFDYTFGKGREGNPQLLKQYFDKVYVVDKVTFNDEKISSTALRKAVINCEFKKYSDMCGRPYYITGCIEHGNAIGSKNGTPTINVRFDDTKMLPPDGVYITRVKLSMGEYIGVTSLGEAPTFERAEYILETHLLDFNMNVYDETATVYFYKFLRKITKFESIEKLYIQIKKDIAETKNFFKGLEM